MTEKRQAFGKEGEKAAVKKLKKLGYRILETNYRASFGEIDIVAEHDAMVVFVEVKSRTTTDFGLPAAAVTVAKQKKLVRLAKSFLAKHKITQRDCRFDVVSVLGEPGNPKSWEVEVIPDAFRG